MVGATGINCTLNACVCTNAAQPKGRLAGGSQVHCPKGQDICWWPGASCLPAL